MALSLANDHGDPLDEISLGAALAALRDRWKERFRLAPSAFGHSSSQDLGDPIDTKVSQIL